MKKILPGTVQQYDLQDGAAAFDCFSPIFSLTMGLSLAQVREITGLSTSAIQNWVKRGWVAAPVNKRYEETHLARILIINTLRNSMQLDKIAYLLNYVNGSVEDRTDDIVPDKQLYNYLCAIVFDIEGGMPHSAQALTDRISEVLQDYSGPEPDSKQKLADALHVMALTHLSARLKSFADSKLEQMM